MVKLTVKESARSDQSNRLYTLEAVELNEKAPAALWVDATIKADGFDPTSLLSVEAIYKLANAVQNNKFLQAGSGSRGGFDPQQLTTILTKKADLSTYLHETSHFYLEALSRIAAMPEAIAHDKADMQTLLEWFGVENLDAWNAMALEEQRKHHESFAYNFELYMFEGKAPSLKLQQVFDRFRSSQPCRQLRKNRRNRGERSICPLSCRWLRNSGAQPCAGWRSYPSRMRGSARWLAAADVLIL